MGNSNWEALLLKQFCLVVWEGIGNFTFYISRKENFVVTVPHGQLNSTDMPEMVLLHVSALLKQVCLLYNSVMF